ncbi:T-complex protein 1 subunit zeta [Echinops telfairi]|uniref:T-complex protein 1 subunit zeta n=1 Tax=Echinops telfairi TaxID=9371 RepID=A0AC55CJN0_ECHTE|nr:T-complex protein 1 subunit zeta [Echinops telfairi]
MSAVKTLNPKAEVARAQAALAVNISAARGLQDVLRTNLGPKGTMKMLVSGAGDIKLTKDGNVLLHEMGLHPRIITEGFEAAKEKALQFLEQIKVSKEMDRETLIDVARTSLHTKVHAELADVLTEAVVDSILAIKKQDEPIDLFMVEIMEMRHKSETDTSCSSPCSLGCVVPGAGAVEVAMAEALMKHKPSIKGRAQLGVQAFADALLIIPKVLAQNSGFDLQETLVKVRTEHSESGQLVGVDLNTGEPMVAAEAGVWDNYCVKKQLLHSCTVIATNILLVDEIMRAGMSSLKG